MKSVLLGSSFLFFSYIVYYYLDHRESLVKRYHKTFPKFFSPNNKAAISVSEFDYEVRPIDNDIIQPLPNEQYEYVPNDFLIDDTEKLRLIDLHCEPDSFGYSVERGNEVFPYHGYPKCSKVNNQEDTYLHIDRENNVVYMNCPENTNNKILTGPIDNLKITYREEGHKNWEVKSYTNPLSAENIEFGLGSCEKDDEYLQQVDMFPIFNKTAYEKAQKKIKSKPRIVYFLTLDSLSRRHFFRKLPRVINLLNTLNKNSSFSVFDFLLHNNQGTTSPKNQAPIFSGDAKFRETNIKDKNQDLLGKKALWYKLREKGYISFVGFEDCDGSFVDYIGKIPDVEYTVGPFYCAVETFTENSFRKEINMQRCLGGHQTHFYILNFTDNIVDLNPGVNLMLYNHLSAAHENTGQHAETLNDDITEYLENFLRKYSEKYEILIFLQADHGMRYGVFYNEIAAYQENKLPGFFLIASKSLLDQFPYSYNALATNTQRLVSKMDYRKTVLSMEGIQEYNPKAIDLFSEIAPTTRSCADMDIPAWECSCLKMREISNPSTYVKKLVKFLINYAEQVINTQGHSNKNYPIGKFCKQIFLTNIKKIYHTAVNNVEEMYKVEVESSTRENMKFAITFSVVSDNWKMKVSDKEILRYETGAYWQYPIKTRVFTI